MRTTLAILMVSVLGLVACGGDENEALAPADTTTETAPATTETETTPPAVETTSEPEPAPKPERKTGAAKFSGVHRDNYETAKVICGANSPAKVPREFDAVGTSPTDAAQAYSDTYRPAFRTAVFEGCLAGFRKR